MVFENLKTAGVQNTKKGERLMLENLRAFASRTGMVHFQGEYTEKGIRKRAAVSIGPEYDTVGYDLVRRAAREAVDLFDMLIVCGFAFAPEVDDTRLNFGGLSEAPSGTLYLPIPAFRGACHRARIRATRWLMAGYFFFDQCRVICPSGALRASKTGFTAHKIPCAQKLIS